MTNQDMPPVELTPETQESRDRPYWQDLNPNFLAGENYGDRGPHPELTARTAYDVKDAHNRHEGMSDDDLKQIPILPTGSRLEQGATYIDLHESTPAEFTARGDMEARESNWFVPKNQVAYPLWNQLIGVRNPERLDREGET